MQNTLLKAKASTPTVVFGSSRPKAPSRAVLAQARQENILAETCKQAAIAAGAVLLIASPFSGPAIARPSDFIQSKPSSSPGQPTNVDKFPYNPSTTGNKAGKDTGDQVNPNENPQAFSNNQGLGKAQTGSEANDPIPSPLDMGPDPQSVGKR